MKNTKLKKIISEMSSNTPFTSPAMQVKDVYSHSIPQEWEVSYIDHKQLILVEQGIFHFEMILKSVVNENGSRTVSRIKVCPHTILHKGIYYTFFINPVDKISRCNAIPDIQIKWKEGFLYNLVYSYEECTPDEQFNKHKVLLENFISKEYLPEILKTFDMALQGA